MVRLALIALALVLSVSAAQARHHHHYRPVQQAQSFWSPGWVSAPPQKIHSLVYNTPGTRYLPHPAGCPARLFCGCGAAVEAFGSPRRDLWLAANWLRFPSAAPAPGMAAARPGHVFILKEHVQGDTWMAIDHNSGGGLSRLHAVSIRGFRIVNPHASSGYHRGWS